MLLTVDGGVYVLEANTCWDRFVSEDAERCFKPQALRGVLACLANRASNANAYWAPCPCIDDRAPPLLAAASSSSFAAAESECD